MEDFKFDVEDFDAFVICTSIPWFPPRLKDAALTLLTPLFNTYGEQIICLTNRFNLKNHTYGIPEGMGSITY